MNWVVCTCLWLGLASALVGGVFLSFSDFVMRGLTLADPAGGMESMQQLNRTVFRSIFITMFVGLVPATVSFALYAWFRLDGYSQFLVMTAAITYVSSVFLVTGMANVPMNERLDKLSHLSSEGHNYWATYGRAWTRWNHVRTIGSLVTSICLLTALSYLH